MWWIILAVWLIIGGLAAALQGSPPEGIGAPTWMTLAGISALVLGICVGGWRIVVAIAGIE